MDTAKAHAAAAAFLEASTRTAMQRATTSLERRVAREVAGVFVGQGKRMVKALRPLRGRFDSNAALAESLTPSDWDYLINAVLLGDAALMGDIIGEAHIAGLVAGAKIAIDGIANLNMEFQTTNPLAVAWAEARAAKQVTRINETTRDRLNRLLVDAIAENKGWDTVADLIIEQFNDFAGPPLFPSKKFTSRAQMIAAFEIGDAYEAGGFIAMQMAEGAGAKMEKRWLNAGDAGVRDAHRTNAGDGWLPLEGSFSGDGATRPPTDGGCRCTLIYRRRRA